MNHKLFHLSLLLVLLAPIARADDASKATKIQELFTVTHVDRQMSQMADQMLAQMNGMMKQQTAGSDLTAQQELIMSSFTTKVAALIRGQLAWEKLRPQFTELYASTYTESEIDAILAFYRSPAGQSMLAKLPDLNAKSIKIGQGQVASLVPQLREMSQDFAKQMTAAAKPSSTAPRPPATTPSPSSTTPAPAH